MKPRRFNIDSDLETYAAWHKGAGNPVPTPDYLPENGLVIEHYGLPLCLGFVYKTDSNTAIIEGIVKNPSEDKELVRKSLQLLTKELRLLARDLGFKHVFAYGNKTSVVERFKEEGFIPVFENVTTFNRRA